MGACRVGSVHDCRALEVWKRLGRTFPQSHSSLTATSVDGHRGWHLLRAKGQYERRYMREKLEVTPAANFWLSRSLSCLDRVSKIFGARRRAVPTYMPTSTSGGHSMTTFRCVGTRARLEPWRSRLPVQHGGTPLRRGRTTRGERENELPLDYVVDADEGRWARGRLCDDVMNFIGQQSAARSEIHYSQIQDLPPAHSAHGR